MKTDSKCKFAFVSFPDAASSTTTLPLQYDIDWAHYTFNKGHWPSSSDRYISFSMNAYMCVHLCVSMCVSVYVISQ